MKIGILGGTFNPIHQGHINLANFVLENTDLDKIILIPNNFPPHKEIADNISFKDRLRMAELATNSFNNISVSDIEGRRSGKSFTIDTIKLLQKSHPDDEFYFIIGDDMVRDLPNWKKVNELNKLLKFIAVSRDNKQTESPFNVRLLPGFNQTISSSGIRNEIKKNKSIAGLVPDKVQSYISERGLYNGC